MEVEIGDFVSTERDSKSGQKCGKRRDTLWGAWFFFSFYFKAAVREGEEESNALNKEVFMVQHDMENMYMWAFKERPENALGKMQLRSYMNGRAREGDPPFPFTPERGFARSHRMQRKRYRGLSNPQCLHAVLPVPAPDLSSLPLLRLRWLRLTGRPWDHGLPPEARDFASWRDSHPFSALTHKLAGAVESVSSLSYEARNLGSLSGTHHRSFSSSGGTHKLAGAMSPEARDFCSLVGTHKLVGAGESNSSLSYEARDFGTLGGTHKLAAATVESVSSLSNEARDSGSWSGTQQLAGAVESWSGTRRLESEPGWAKHFTGAMENVTGPVTGAKTIYEDEKSYLIVVTMPCVDLRGVRVSWRNMATHGVVKVSGVSNARLPFLKRRDRVFRLADPSSEHCPPGHFVREIPLSTLIFDGAEIEAHYDGPRSLLEIVVPKLPSEAVEHEIRVCFRPKTGLTCA